LFLLYGQSYAKGLVNTFFFLELIAHICVDVGELWPWNFWISVGMVSSYIANKRSGFVDATLVVCLEVAAHTVLVYWLREVFE